MHELEKSGSGVKAGTWESDIMEDEYVPHRHDHYTCMLLEEGELDVLLDAQPLTMQKWTLFISYPDQVHQVLKSKKGKGWYLSFSNHLIDESVRNTLDQSIAEIVSVTLNAEEFKWYSSLIISMQNLPLINHMAHSEVARPLLEAFLAQALLTYRQKEQHLASQVTSRPSSITRKFRVLVRQNYRVWKRPADYAAHLHVSVQYLNDTIKKVTGHSSSQIIQNEVIREAQRLLYFTELSVKEIAQSLGYSDLKYFTRFYGKKVGISPGHSRKDAHNS